MSVRLRKWKTKDGTMLERRTIDVKVAPLGKAPRRIRDFSPVNTHRGAQPYERQVREALLAGTLGKEVQEVPTLEAFQARFLDHAVVNNKPATVCEKRWVLRLHLVPAFGRRRLDAIGSADIEAYEARKLREGQQAKSVNGHLWVLRKPLDSGALRAPQPVLSVAAGLASGGDEGLGATGYGDAPTVITPPSAPLGHV